jgi:hypothetical protein
MGAVVAMTIDRFTSPLRPHADRASSFRHQELIKRLRELPAGPGPDSAFTRVLRAELLAAGVPISAAAGVPTSGLRKAGIRRANPSFGLGAAAAVVAVLIGVVAVMSGGSRSGGSQYALKMAGDSLQLSFSGGPSDKGYSYLKLATERAVAATEFTADTASRFNRQDARLITDTLANADSDTRNGMRYLAAATNEARSATPLADLGPWIASQRAVLSRLQMTLPAGTVQARANQSAALLDRVELRLAGLRSAAACSCLAQSGRDDLGPLPCSPCASQPPSGPVVSPGVSAAPGASGSASATAASRGIVPTASGTALNTSRPTALPTASLSRPRLPASITPSLPVTIAPSGSSAALPGISVGVGVTLPSAGGSSHAGVDLTLPGLPPIHLPEPGAG